MPLPKTKCYASYRCTSPSDSKDRLPRAALGPRVHKYGAGWSHHTAIAAAAAAILGSSSESTDVMHYNGGLLKWLD